MVFESEPSDVLGAFFGVARPGVAILRTPMSPLLVPEREARPLPPALSPPALSPRAFRLSAFRPAMDPPLVARLYSTVRERGVPESSSAVRKQANAALRRHPSTMPPPQ